MKGDFTRFTYNPEKHFSSVLKQQGRVDLDADWNEYTQIQDYLKGTSNRDIIGESGVPYNNRNGFLVSRTGDNKILQLNGGKPSPGRIYVDGILCELEKDLLSLPNPKNDGSYMVYLDVWQRHITVIEDSSIAEIALGGPDTTTRIKTEWHVRFLASDKEDKGAQDYCKFRSKDGGWTPNASKKLGKLQAQAEKVEISTGLCEVEAKAGYRGLENRLYRVEIHNPGPEATFKWSRDDGSVVYSIQSLTYNSTTGTATIITKQPAKDEYLALKIGDWIEISDDQDELNLEHGLIAQVAEGSDPAKRTVVISAALSDINPYLSKSATNCKLRRWDQKTTSEVDLVNGTIKVTPGVWIPLEEGVEVKFTAGDYQIGDYWLIPARTRSRDIIWPSVDDDTPLALPRKGIEHHYCMLALANYEKGLWSEPVDCRRLFPSLNDLKPACCIPVHPGENIQEVINCVIASGGGCICLCDGVHDVCGPLKLTNAYNLTICGENTATVVSFRANVENGTGGFILENCRNVTLSGMLLMGRDLPSLISTGSLDSEEPNFNITLNKLTLFNRGSYEEFTGHCAILLGNTETISIEGCRMLAENGIVSRFGDNLPVFEKVQNVRVKSRRKPVSEAVSGTNEMSYGVGVLNLQMKDSFILYRRYGIWSLKSVDWNISGCRILPITGSGAILSEKELVDIDARQKKAGLDSKMEEADKTIVVEVEKISKVIINKNVAEYFESSLAAKPDITVGTAIKSLIWQACRITNCTLGGSVGLNVIFWIGGRMNESSLVTRTGLLVLWLHEGVIANNTINGNLAGIVVSGCYSSNIEANRISAAVAIENSAVARWFKGLPLFLSEINRVYNADPEDKQPARIILWLLLEEACSELGLEEIRDAVQLLLDTIPNYKNIDILLLLAIKLYPGIRSLSNTTAAVPMPLIALKITRNEISSGAAGIRLRNFIPMGGLSITNNRIQTLTGQAVELKANPYTVNPYIVIVVMRYAGKMLPGLFSSLLTSKKIMKLVLARKDAFTKIFKLLEIRLTGLGQFLEPILEADYRIENNTIRSQFTAIEANIFELAVQNNHVTMTESRYSNEEAADIADVLDQNNITHKLGTVMKTRSKVGMKVYARSMGAADTTDKAGLSDAAAQIKQKTSNPDLQAEADKLQQAAKSNNVAKVQESLNNITDILTQYIDTCGIWVKGAGCRVIGNQVVVPLDADSKTWAQGGIRFWDDEGSPIWFIIFLEQLLKVFRPNLEIPSLLGATETLIDNNEVNRGIGNGVEIGGIANLPKMGLSDLKIRGNQIRDMAGAGIAFDERSITTGVDIEDNRILDCGSNAGKGIMVSQKGGIVMRNTIACRIHNNRIKCQSNVSLANNLFAVDLQYVFGLSMTDNHIEHLDASNQKYGEAGYAKKVLLTQQNNYLELIMENMCGAVKVIGAFGEIDIQNNEFINQRGMGVGLLMRGIYAQETLPEVFGLMTASTFNTPMYFGSTGAVQGNYFLSMTESIYMAFLISRFNDLNFLGNNVRINGAGYIRSVYRNLISSNMLDSLTLANVNIGVICGNVSNQAIIIPASFSGKSDGSNTT